MRKVKFNKYVNVNQEPMIQTDFPNSGMFLGFGSASTLIDGWVDVHTIALIEVEGGTIEEVLPERFKFIDPLIPEKPIEENVCVNLWELK